MQSFLGIFNTDLVNKYKQRIPLRALAKSFIDSPSGLPQCLGHDMHRPAGWAELLGLHFEKTFLESLKALGLETPKITYAECRIV